MSVYLHDKFKQQNAKGEAHLGIEKAKPYLTFFSE